MTAKDIGLRILYLCMRRNWSLYRLGRETGIPYSTLRSICYEDVSPQLETVQKISDGFNLSLSALFAEEDGLSAGLSQAQLELLEKSKSFGEQDMKRILAYMDGLLERERK